MPPELPEVICFRVTRACNARCGFCLAPPDGAHPSAATLTRRIDWLLAHGVTTVHFCGGEPTIHPALPQLLGYVRASGGKCKLTTNGIAFAEDLVPALRAADCQVKVSIHGDRARHNELVGRDAFDATTGNLRRLLAASVAASVQTTVVAGGGWVVDWVAAFCLTAGVRRLSVLPFIPRGSGLARRGEYELSAAERRALRAQVARQRAALRGRLDVRWLDFTARPVHAVEPDGRVVLEGATEARDEVLWQLNVGENVGVGNLRSLPLGGESAGVDI
jgi:MoaA/NifB/PqqE/SkfB family radical SAM enzyme